MSTEITNRQAWLWADASGQAFLSTGSALYGPASLQSDEALNLLRRDASIHAVLPPVLAKPFMQPQWNALVLHHSLPEVWHRFEWETLRINGKILSRICSVTRLAKPFVELNTVRRRLLVVTPLAENDPVQFAVSRLMADERVGAISRWGTPKYPQEIEQEWRAERDLAEEFSDLMIIAHGGECEQIMMLDAHGQPWLEESGTLPRLPARVWLFVCSDLNGNLTPLVKRMLENGAQQVLYGHGKLEADRMVDVYTAWLASASEPMTCSMAGIVGSNTLRLAGCVPMLQPDLLTLEQDQGLGTDPIKRLKTSPLDLISKKQNLHESGPIAKYCWPRTQNWLFPYLMYVSEVQQNHEARLQFQCLWDALEDSVRVVTPATARFLAKSAHRDGRFVQQVRYLDQVLSLCIDHPDMHDFTFDALLSMTNLWIDMNLPKQNGRLIGMLDELLEKLPAREIQPNTIKLLDVKARQSLRAGQGKMALDFCNMRTSLESQQPTWSPSNAARVLATALYTAAWIQHSSADERAKQCLETLTLIPMDDHAYLCRALALYCWRCPEGEQRTLAESACHSWLDWEFKQQRHRDFGPLAVTAAALLLCPLVPVRHELLTIEWEGRLRVGLQEQRYWLELASWSSFLGDPVAAQGALESFHAQRQAVVDEIGRLRTLQAELDCADLDSESKSRSAQEESLLAVPAPSLQHWLDQGCVPL